MTTNCPDSLSLTIAEHLGENWWERVHDPLTLSVLLDRLREEQGWGLRTAVYWVARTAEGKLYRTDDSFAGPREREGVRGYLMEGDLSRAANYYANRYYRAGHPDLNWHDLLYSLSLTVDQMGFDSSLVPE